MKLLLLLTAISLFSTSAFSQLNKNQFLVGGNVSFSSLTNKGDDLKKNRSTTFQFAPDIGYFIFDQLVLGGKIGISFYKSTVDYAVPYNYKTSSINLSPFVRYYILPKMKKVNVFAETDFSFLRATETDLSGEYKLKKNGSAYTVLAGPVYFVNPHVALEFTVAYNSSKYADDSYFINTFMTGLGLQIHLGGKKNKS